MAPNDYKQMAEDVSELKIRVAEIHGFLLGARLASNGKKGWLEATEDRLEVLESGARWVRGGILSIMGTLGTALTVVVTLSATGTFHAVRNWLGLR